MLVLVPAVEVGLARSLRDFEALIKVDWWCQGRAARCEAARRAEILCFGDSLVKTGVIPAALEARLDRTAYNLAGLNAPAPVSYFLLRRALESGAQPRALIVDANAPQLWGADFHQDAASWASLLEPREAWELAQAERDPDLLNLYFLHRALPSARFRSDVRFLALNRLLDSPAEYFTAWRQVVERQGRRNDGALLLPSPPKKLEDRYRGGKLSPPDHAIWYRKGPLAKPTNLVYLDRFLRLAESRGIPVFFLIPPIHPDILEIREIIGVEAEYLEFVRGLSDGFPNVVVVDGRHTGYDYTRFTDTCHLTIDGATALSNALAEVLAARLDGPPDGDRWVALPPYAEPTARLAVEVRDESMAAVAWWRLIR
jgi:hypothetical protein